MHAFCARPGGVKSLQLAIITAHTASTPLLSSLFLMAKQIAAALNAARLQEGIQLLGGAEEAGIRELLLDFLDEAAGSDLEEVDSMALM